MRDWKLCTELGITAVPTFVIDHQSVVGAQPYEVLEQFLENNGVKKRGVRRQEAGVRSQESGGRTQDSGTGVRHFEERSA